MIFLSKEQMKEVDDVAVDKGISIMQLMENAGYQMAEFISKITPIDSKIAFLVNEIQILPDKFFENVAKNRMVNAFVTINYKEAINWYRKAADNGVDYAKEALRNLE